MPHAIGKIKQIIGPVIDVQFEDGELPHIYNAVSIEHGGSKVICEVMHHIGNHTVRCVSMSSTDGLQRGMAVHDTGAPIIVPVGNEMLGRVVNVLGEPIDNMGPVDSTHHLPIHRIGRHTRIRYFMNHYLLDFLLIHIQVIIILCKRYLAIYQRRRA